MDLDLDPLPSVLRQCRENEIAVEVDGEPVQSLQPALQALGCNSCMELAPGAALDRAVPAKTKFLLS